MDRKIERMGSRELAYLKEVLDNQFHTGTNGQMTKRLEKTFADTFGVKYAISQANGTSTLHTALAAFGVGPGDEVIVPPLTMSSTVFAVLHANAVPVFADICADTFTIDPVDIERKITPRTKAIIPVAIFGLAPDMDPIMEIARKHNLNILEDDAQCLLGYYKNKSVRDIDIAIDKAEAQFQLENAKKIGSIFLVELQKMYIDLSNIRTMMRIKFTESQDMDVFMPGGYIEAARLIACIDGGYETMAQAFVTTPYGHIIEAGVSYLQKENSFLKLESACDEHLLGFLKTTREITAGYQPIVAYMLAKEHEIRMIRMVLTAKRNCLESELILDRLTV